MTWKPLRRIIIPWMASLEGLLRHHLIGIDRKFVERAPSGGTRRNLRFEPRDERA